MSSLFTIESLEIRRLLAGNVTLAVDPTTGALDIRGDNKDNQIRMELITAEDLNQPVLIGLNGTKINGGTEPVPFSLADIRVNLGNGNDSFETGLDIPSGQSISEADLIVETGNGDDHVVIDRWTFRPIVISTGNGNDRVDVSNAVGMTLLDIDTGNGDDAIHFSGEVLTGNIHLNGGNGRDTLTGIGVLQVDNGGSTIIERIEQIA